MKIIKTILYLVFLVPLTIATVISVSAVIWLINAYESEFDPNDYIQSEEFIEMRLEKLSCSEEEKKLNPSECAGLQQAAMASGGAFAFISILALSSIFLVPFLILYLIPAMRRIVGYFWPS
jgi:hypothetical protein